MTLQTAPFHRVLYRPALFLGGERHLSGPAAVAAVGLAGLGQNLVALAVAGLLWFVAMYLFREMAKADPQLSSVYRRQIRYRGYYPPRSRPYVGQPRIGRAMQALILAGGPVAFFALVYWKA